MVTRIEVLSAPNLKTIAEFARSRSNGVRFVFSDLSMGAWRGSQVASEFGSQLGSSWKAQPKSISTNYADVIGNLIDTETAGDVTILTQWRNAKAIIDSVKNLPCYVFAVLAPRSGRSWEPENIWFIDLFAKCVHATNNKIIVICTDTEGTVFPQHWRLEWRQPHPPREEASSFPYAPSFIPGILDEATATNPEIAEELTKSGFLRLPSGHILIAPESRSVTQHGATEYFDRLASGPIKVPWLHAYVQCFSEKRHVDSFFLCKEAWARWSENGSEIALRLLRRSVGCARTSEQLWNAETQLRGLQIALEQFESLATGEDPSEDVPATVRWFLLQAKAWGLVMTGRPQLAEPYFALAQRLMSGSEQTRAYLYLLNISALNRLKLGDIDGASIFEQRITDELSRKSEVDWHLKYINALNTARLFRRKNMLDQAAVNYREAFLTTSGAKSESDLIYENLCWARLHATAARPDRALQHWIRVALHWVCSEIPEAVAPRVIRALLDGKDCEADVVEQVSGILIGEFERLVGTDKRIDAAVANAEGNLQLCSFGILGESEDQMRLVAGESGWGVVLGDSIRESRLTGPMHMRLRHILQEFVRKACPDDFKFSAIRIDSRFGNDIGADATELVETNIRLKIPRLYFEGDAAVMTTAGLDKLEMQCRVQLSDAVRGLEEKPEGAGFVQFKRYLPPRIIPKQLLTILRNLADVPDLASFVDGCCEGVSRSDSIALLRTLESLRMIRVLPPSHLSSLVCQGN